MYKTYLEFYNEQYSLECIIYNEKPKLGLAILELQV